MIQCAQKLFSKHARTTDPKLTALNVERMQLLKLRRDMRENMIDAPSDPLFQDICAQLATATRKAKLLRKQTFEVKREMLIEELWEGWHVRRFAECNKLLTALGSPKSGPKRRAYTTLRRALSQPC